MEGWGTSAPWCPRAPSLVYEEGNPVPEEAPSHSQNCSQCQTDVGTPFPGRLGRCSLPSMSNTALLEAMRAKQVSDRQLAEYVGVDIKTVARWLACPERLPHLKTRWLVADVLQTEERVIWPTAVRDAVKTGTDKEIVATYATAADVHRPDLGRFIKQAKEQLFFAKYTGYRLWTDIPFLANHLRARAQQGCRVRFVVGDPAAEITRITDQAEQGTATLPLATRINMTLQALAPLHELVEVRQTALVYGRGTLWADNEAIVSPSVVGHPGHLVPQLHLRRKMEGGLFDQLVVRHCEQLWEHAAPIQLSS